MSEVISVLCLMFDPKRVSSSKGRKRKLSVKDGKQLTGSSLPHLSPCLDMESTHLTLSVSVCGRVRLAGSTSEPARCPRF